MTEAVPTGSFRPAAAFAALAVVIGVHPVLSLYVGNPHELARIGPALVLSVAVSVVAIAVALAVARLTPVRAERALALAVLAIIGFQNAGVAAEERTSLIAGIVVLAGGGLLLARYASHPGAPRVAAAIAFVLVVSNAIGYVQLRSISVLEVAQAQPVEAAPNAPKPDVFFIVLDGFPRADVLAEVYDHDAGPFQEALRERGFDIRSDALANYSMTFASLAATLSMDYPIDDGDVIDDERWRTMQAIIGGANPVVSSFTAAAYDVTFLEGGSAISRCGPQVACVSAPIWDEGFWTLLERTAAIEPVRSSVGDYATASALDRLRRTTELAREPSAAPRLVLSHVLLPHPPMLLDELCELRTPLALRGRILAHPASEPRIVEVRRRAFGEQLTCLERLVLDLVDAIDDDAIVYLTADHGGDSFGQLGRTPDAWTDIATRERMAIFAAARMPGCGPVPRTPVNAFRAIVPCALGAAMEPLPDRHLFVPPHSHGERAEALRRV